MNKLPPSAVNDFIRLVSITPIELDIERVKAEGPTWYESVYDEIRSVLKRPDDGKNLPVMAFLGLTRPLEIATRIGYGPIEASDVLNSLRDAIRTLECVALLSDTEAWVNAITIIRRSWISGATQRISSNNFDRSGIVSRSFLRLKDEGYEITLAADQIGLTQSSADSIYARIDYLVSRLGGLATGNAIFELLTRQKKLYRGVYILGRSTSMLPRPQDPSIPFHYIYNLALKHMEKRTTSVDPEDDWLKLLDLTRDFASSLDVEEYSSMAEVAGMSPFFINRTIRDAVLYDELFTFPQWSTEKARQTIAYWLDAWSASGCDIQGATIAEWKRLSLSLLEQASPKAFQQTRAHDHTSTGMPVRQIKKLLDILSVPAKRLNRNYHAPFDTKERNAPFLPLLRIGLDLHYIPPKAMFGRALYERFATLIRQEQNRQTPNNFGRALEHLTIRILEESFCKPTFINCKYAPQGSTKIYEVDAVVETEEDIYFFECKSKVLSSPSRAGHPAVTLSDLANSLLGALSQSLTHEISLRKRDVLTFTNGVDLHRRGRTIQHVVVTALDHGSLQSRMFIRSFLAMAFDTRFSSDDSEVDKLLKHFNQIAHKIKERLEIVATLTQKDIHEVTRTFVHSTWWLSADQLLLLISGKSSIKDAFPLRNTIFGSGDLMSEIAHAAKMLDEARLGSANEA